MRQRVVYIHGKGGSAAEAEHYQPLFPECEVLGFEYQAGTPWEAKEEFPVFFDDCRKTSDSIIVIANSIGAFLTMSALSEEDIDRAFFISPIIDMEKLIQNMMVWAKVTETDLQREGEIRTAFGETLSWKYLCYVRQNPITWNVKTSILYGEKDTMTSFSGIQTFADRIKADLTVMPNGEHWFHTEEQLQFLDTWIRTCQPVYEECQK